MGEPPPVRWAKRVAKTWLKRRGLTLQPRDRYQEKLEGVRYLWLREMGVKTVVDVGAGDGGFARRASAWFPAAQFFCFEPLEDQFAGLQARVGLDSRFTLVRAALCDRAGESTFFRNDYAGSSSLLPMAEAHRVAYPFTATVHPTPIECTTLDRYFAERLLDKKVFLKLDVQGGELLVLQGAANTLLRTDAVYLEVSFQELYVGQPLVEDIIAFLGVAGFSLVGIENVSQSLVDGRCLQADAFFVRRPC